MRLSLLIKHPTQQDWGGATVQDLPHGCASHQEATSQTLYWSMPVGVSTLTDVRRLLKVEQIAV